MGAAWSRARAELRRRWRATLALAVLVGIAGGAALTGVAGARRTESAMARFVAFSQPADVFVVSPDGALDLDSVARLPQVADAADDAYAILTPSTPTGAPDPAAVGSINPFVRTRQRGPVATSDIPYLVEGRLADPRAPLEVVVNEEAAARHGLRPGDRFRMWAYTPEQFGGVLVEGTTLPEGRAFDFEVSGIVRLPFDLDPRPSDPEVIYTGRGSILLGPAFWAAHGHEVAAFGGQGDSVSLRLDDGSDGDAFLSAVRALPGGEAAEIQVGSEAAKVQAEAEQATGVEAAALVAFAALAAVAGLLVVGQGLARQVQLEASEQPCLRALGMTRSQLLGASLLWAGAVAVPGAVLAVALAVVASPLTPVGLARRAEIDPGLAVDVTVLATGAGVVALAVLARAGLSAWRRSSPSPTAHHGGRQSRAVSVLAGAGAPHPAVAGVAMALDGRGGDGGGAARTAAVGTLAAVALAGAALTFGASLDHLATTPELQGWAWDVVVGNPNGEEDLEVLGAQRLEASPYVDGFSAVSETLEPLVVGGLHLDAAGIDLVSGQVYPPLVEGRPARAPGEVVLGGRSMERLGVSLGERVEARLGGQDLSLQVVGQAVLNPAVQFSFALDEGAVLSLDQLRQARPDGPTTHFLVRYAEGVDSGEAFAALQSDWGKTVLRSQPTVEVENLRRVAGLPNAVAALVAVLAAGTLAHAVVTSVRARRADLAVLKTLGFRRRDLAATVGFQASTLVVSALALGLPLAVVAGRWAWRVVADGLGAPPPVTPLLAVSLIAPAALLLANLVAALPARAAARLRPAVALRSE